METIIGMLLGGIFLAAFALFGVKLIHYIGSHLIFTSRRFVFRAQKTMKQFLLHLKLKWLA